MPNTNNEIGKLYITDPEFKQKTWLLEKHFYDRTLQPMSEFNKTGEKEVCWSSGFQAGHEYSESDKATFMIKSVLNHILTEEAKQSKLEQFKNPLIKEREKLQNCKLLIYQIL